jgi:hypothetical protein
MIMHTEKKQSYRSFMQEAARKKPDYSIGALAHMWADDIIQDRTNAGSPPRTVETTEILEECLNRIHAAVESGELEAIYPEKDIEPELHLSNGELIRGALKFPSRWIVDTEKYIEWARANGVGPSDLVDDVIEDIKTEVAQSESINALKQNSKLYSKLDARERTSLLKIIAALCEKAGVRPDDDGLAKELEGIIQKLGDSLESRAISRHLKKAADLVK